MNINQIQVMLQDASSLDEAVSILHANGIDVTPEQFQAASVPENAEDLSESSLEDVTGGTLPVLLGVKLAKWLIGQFVTNTGSSGGGHSGGGGRHF